MNPHYLFQPTGQCYFLPDQQELKLLNHSSNQWQYQHKKATLTITKLNKKTITVTLTAHHNPGSIYGWEDADRGQAVYDPQKGAYVLKFGLPKIFHLTNDEYRPQQPWQFTFHYQTHLILKDKDVAKPYYWYYYDYTEEISNFVYKTLNPYLLPDKGQIVALPGEQGQACEPWSTNDYLVNYFYCGEDEENTNYDFSQETYQNWLKNNPPPALIITFLPTYFKNYELPRGQKLTGTTWFKKIWEVFGTQKVPIVLKCYRGFIFINLYRNHRPIYEQINHIIELPSVMDGREVGKSNLLVFFNMPFLNKNQSK